MTTENLSENVLAVLQALAFQRLVNAANDVNADLYELLNTAVTLEQIDATQGLSGLVWMTSTKHKVH